LSKDESNTMTIRTTLGDLVKAEPVLHGLCALKLPALAAYHLKKLRALVAAETSHFNEERDRYVTELGAALDDGAFRITPEHEQWPEFVRRMEALVAEWAAVPVEIAWRPVTLELLGDARVSSDDLTALGPLFAEPVEPIE